MYKEQTEENRGPWYTRRIPKRDDETGRKDIDIARRMTRFQLRPPRLRNVENPISRSNGRKLERENEGKIGRKTKQDRGNRNCAAQLSAYHGVARLIKVCCYAVVNLAEGGEREGKGGEKRRWLILREHFVRLEN